MTTRTLAEWAGIARRVADAPSERFTDLVETAGLDPATELRFADLSGVSFAGCNLSGYDLTGAKLIGCDFEGAKLLDCELAGVIVDHVNLGHRHDGQQAASLRGVSWFGCSTALSKAIDWKGVQAVKWTPRRLEELRTLWREGLSASQIAHRIGGVSRNAVIGKVHRLGLGGRAVTMNRGRHASPPKRLVPTSTANVVAPRAVRSDRHLRPGAIFIDAPFAPEMVVVPSGSYFQDDKTKPGNGVNRPDVTIGNRLAVGRYPMLLDEWSLFVVDNATEHKPENDLGRERQAVLQVSWDDISQNYLPWLNGKLGLTGDYGYRLLSEAEWEYCCRAGTKTATDTNVEGRGQARSSAKRFNNNAELDKTKMMVEVGSLKSNAWGLYYTRGRLWEWCQDGSPATYFGRLAPEVKDKDVFRVLRGGAHTHRLGRADGAGFVPVNPKGPFGFRLARTLSN